MSVTSCGDSLIRKVAHSLMFLGHGVPTCILLGNKASKHPAIQRPAGTWLLSRRAFQSQWWGSGRETEGSNLRSKTKQWVLSLPSASWVLSPMPGSLAHIFLSVTEK